MLEHEAIFTLLISIIAGVAIHGMVIYYKLGRMEAKIESICNRIDKDDKK